MSLKSLTAVAVGTVTLMVAPAALAADHDVPKKAEKAQVSQVGAFECVGPIFVEDPYAPGYVEDTPNVCPAEMTNLNFQLGASATATVKSRFYKPNKRIKNPTGTSYIPTNVNPLLNRQTNTTGDIYVTGEITSTFLTDGPTTPYSGDIGIPVEHRFTDKDCAAVVPGGSCTSQVIETFYTKSLAATGAGNMPCDTGGIEGKCFLPTTANITAEATEGTFAGTDFLGTAGANLIKPGVQQSIQTSIPCIYPRGAAPAEAPFPGVLEWNKPITCQGIQVVGPADSNGAWSHVSKATKVQLPYVRHHENTCATSGTDVSHNAPIFGATCDPPGAPSPVAFGDRGKGSVKISPSGGKLKVTAKLTGMENAPGQIELRFGTRVSHNQCINNAPAFTTLCTRDPVAQVVPATCSNGNCKISGVKLDLSLPPVGSSAIQVGIARDPVTSDVNPLEMCFFDGPAPGGEPIACPGHYSP